MTEPISFARFQRTVGVRAGIGSTMTGVDVSGAVTVVRTVDLGQYERRGRGLTVMFDVAPGEWCARSRGPTLGGGE